MWEFYKAFHDADFSAIDDLAAKWKEVHEKIKNLDDKILDEVLKPLRDKGYWEGMAAPYAWAQIDDMKRQVTAAAKVAKSVQKSIEDGAGELERAQRELKRAEARPKVNGLRVAKDSQAVIVERMICTEENPDPRKGKEVAAGQRDINAILREAYNADQGLSITLMENIGLERWFNSGKLRMSINSTDSIAPSRFNELDRAMQGKNPHPETNHQSPRDVLMNWATGTGDSDKEFSQHDEFTKQVRESESMAGIREKILNGWRNGKGEGSAAYSISEMSYPEMAGTYVKDVTGLLGVDNLWGGDTNEAQSLLGSYAVDYRVKGAEPDGSLVVQYTLKNHTDMESALPGYKSWQEKFNHESGPTRGIKETVSWTERISADGRWQD